MPHAIEVAEPEFQHIACKQLGHTFGAEVFGVDFTKLLPTEVFAEIERALFKYGILVFRHAGLNDDRHVKFARMFGELDTAAQFVAPGHPHRYKYLELWDVGNVEEDGTVTQLGSKRHHLQMGNYGFHVDLSFNPSRAGISLLRAHQLPPKGTGGGTDFADTRAAYDDLPEAWKRHLEENEYIAAHSAIASRLREGPKDSPWLKGLDPNDFSFGRHDVVQTHEASGRKNLYLANHVHHLEYKNARNPNFVPTCDQPFERVPEELSTYIIESLFGFCSQPKYVLEVAWEENGDVVVWDNTSTMHRAHHGSFEGQYARDMRRCIAHDKSSMARGHNDEAMERLRMTYHVGH